MKDRRHTSQKGINKWNVLTGVMIALVLTLPMAWHIYFNWDLPNALVALKPFSLGMYGVIIISILFYVWRRLVSANNSINYSLDSYREDTRNIEKQKKT